MNDIYNWNLESFLKKKKLDFWIKKWQSTLEYKIFNLNKFCLCQDNFASWMLNLQEEEKSFNTISNYISNHKNEDLSNKKWIEYEQKLLFIENKYAEKLSNLANVYLQNEKKIKKFLQIKKFKIYQRFFALIFKKKGHVLSLEQEKLWAKLTATSSGFYNVFLTLSCNDLTFNPIKNDEGKKFFIQTSSELMKFMECKDRTLRKNAWISFHSAYSKYMNTFCQTLFNNFLNANNYAKALNYKSYVDFALSNDEIDKVTLFNLYKNIQTFKDIYIKYIKIKKQIYKENLKLNKIEPWDLTANYTKNETYTIKQAKEIILQALSPLKKEYLSILNKAFSEQWISFLPKKGKYTGAYSIGNIYGLDKFCILMNFDNSFESISVLIHELGHSVNSYFSEKEQNKKLGKWAYCDTNIFYAEIASICNETLLFFFNLEKYENDIKTKKYLIMQFINTFFNSTIRQIIFSEWEYTIAENINNEKPFTVTYGIDLYKKLTKKYLGETNCNWDDPIYKLSLSTIFRISHFYMNNLYVYKYAIGQVIGLYVAKRIKDKNMLDKYFNFLKSGSSLSPLKTIEILGISLNDKKIFIEAKETISNLIKVLEKK